ncbi:MAG TPA: fibro-slime domain-containing protein, partial [Polyangiaceae bacterium]|nr:fibro-slime domain-containing protein [Polyangiaceae bacterium]
MRTSTLLVLAPVLALGCSGGDTSAFGSSTDHTNPSADGGGDGSTVFHKGTSDGGHDAGACDPNLTGTLRDFRDDHPDFEKFLGDDRGIVKDTLGPDFKPVYASTTTTPTTTGKADFDQWYRDVPGTNISVPFQLVLTPNGNGVSTFDAPYFFPLDNQAWGNQGRPHNYHFTFEVHLEFAYNGGEDFTFTGDDDVWIFINGKLAIDIGGVHGAESESIDLDARAGELGIVKGNTYAMDAFSAERHTV